jgi:ribonuclease HII
MSTSTGYKAETTAANYLEHNGYKIIARNWRTRFCEIDIVAQKDKTIYFVEVKYRVTSDQGTGFEYITHAKLRQMQFAAEMWVSERQWDRDYRLAAIEVSGTDFAVTGFIDSL